MVNAKIGAGANDSALALAINLPVSMIRDLLVIPSEFREISRDVGFPKVKNFTFELNLTLPQRNGSVSEKALMFLIDPSKTEVPLNRKRQLCELRVDQQLTPRKASASTRWLYHPTHINHLRHSNIDSHRQII